MPKWTEHVKWRVLSANNEVFRILPPLKPLTKADCPACVAGIPVKLRRF